MKVVGLGAKSQSKLNFHQQYDESKKYSNAELKYLT